MIHGWNLLAGQDVLYLMSKVYCITHSIQSSSISVTFLPLSPSKYPFISLKPLLRLIIRNPNTYPTTTHQPSIHFLNPPHAHTQPHNNRSSIAPFPHDTPHKHYQHTFSAIAAYKTPRKSHFVSLLNIVFPIDLRV